jgi:hypothetical protein
MKHLLLPIFIVIGISGSSQIVNIESARMQSDTTGWMGGAGASFSIAKNTRKIFSADMDVHLQYKTQKDLWLILANHGFLKAGSEKYVSHGLIHLRYNTKVNPWLRWEIFAQWQNNLITQIDSRYLVGTGPRFKIFSTKVFRLYAASLMMYEREKERTTPVVKHSDMRNSSYVSFTITPEDHFEIISTTYYQPLLKNFSDHRILNQIVLRTKLGKHFKVSMRWSYLHDRFPAGSAPRTTYSFGSGLEYDL